MAGALALALGCATAASALQMQTYYTSAAGATTLSFDRFSAAGTLTGVEIKFFSAPTLTFSATASTSQSSIFGTITSGGVTYTGLPTGSVFDDYSAHGFAFDLAAGTHTYSQTVAQGDTKVFYDLADFVGSSAITIGWAVTPLTYSVPAATSVTPLGTSFAQPGVRVTYTYSAVVPSVPEPASWAMMIGGFALIGGALRRRRAEVAFG